METDSYYRRAEWLYDPSKYRSQQHIWWTESRCAATNELHWHDNWQGIRLRKLTLYGIFQTNPDIASIGNIRNKLVLVVRSSVPRSRQMFGTSPSRWWYVWYGGTFGGGWWWTWDNHVGHRFSITGARLNVSDRQFLIKFTTKCIKLSWLILLRTSDAMLPQRSLPTNNRVRHWDLSLLHDNSANSYCHAWLNSRSTYSPTDINESVIQGQLRCTRYGGKHFAIIY